MKKHLLGRVLAGALLVCAGGPTWADEVDSLDYVAPPATATAQLKSASVGVIKARSFKLAPVTAAVTKSAVKSTQADSSTPQPLQVGFGRPVADLKSAAATGAQLVWQGQADGSQAAAISVTSPNAVRIRLGVRVYRLPTKAVLRVRSADGKSVDEATGQEIYSLIAANVASGDNSEAAYIWWPGVEGEEAVLEITLPNGVSPSEVEIAVPVISHIYASASTDWKPQGIPLEKTVWPSDGKCYADATCKAEWLQQSNATAHMEFVASAADEWFGRVSICTGTLLNDSGSTRTPYFLTANHCIGSQTVASSLRTFWGHRSTSCNGSSNSSTAIATKGATLLYRELSFDTSFLQLLGSLPTTVPVTFAGWTTTQLANGSPVTGIHSPGGDLLKFSTGTVSGYYRYLEANAAGPANGEYIGVLWNSGVTEGGSSGSALFNNNKQVVGQLRGGYSYCSNMAGKDYYGRFDLAYNAGLRAYLSPITCTKVSASLSSNQKLQSGECLRSPSKRYTFMMQSDGNAVVYDRVTGIWSTKTNGANRFLFFQTNGDLVVYGGSTPVWTSSTFNRGGTRLTMQDDGNLVINRANGSAVWSSKGGMTPFCGFASSTLSAGQKLTANQFLASPNSRYCFLMQSDGNAVIYDVNRGIWSTGTNGANRFLFFQTNGDLVVYGGSTPLWTSATFNRSGTRLTLQDDGNLVIYRANNTGVWSSKGGLVR